MNRKFATVVLVLLLTLLLLGVVAVMAQEPGSPVDFSAANSNGWPVSPNDTYTTVITVTSASDPDDKGGRVCYRDDIPTKVPYSPCTLRRALVEASALSDFEPSAEPILIKFNIPTTDSYDATLDIWTIQLYDTTDTNALPNMDGDQIILDGDTQSEIGGRTDGPKIIIRGNDKGGMVIDGNNNTIRGLAFQTFKDYLILNGDGNLIENNWFGLDDEGQDIHIRDVFHPEDGSGYSGISLAGGITGATGNTIQNNVFAGFTGVAAAIRGIGNTFVGNYVGTTADGTVPLPTQFDQHPCLDNVWFGGSGISVSDRDHQIGGPDEADRNIFAGLYLELFELSTQPPAIKEVGGGQGYLIQNNYIGLDVKGDAVGVCGRGMDFASGPTAMQIISNTIVEPGLSAIAMNHWTLNGNTLQGNIIERESAWPGEQGDNTTPEDAIAYGSDVPDELRGFKPAQVTEVNDTTVTGTSGVGSACALCTVQVFLDDTDAVTEALQLLDVVTAGANGNWSATLPAPLDQGQGLRTMSTVPDDWTISGLDAGTTSNLSELYAADFTVFLPVVVR